MSETEKPVLAFDCALRGCIGAIVQGEKTLGSFSEPMDREQAAMLIPLIQKLLEDSGLNSFSQIGLLVTSVGPGSFTGLRIGMAAAQAMSSALRLPLVGVSTFDCVAATAGYRSSSDGSPFYVLLETRRKDYYIAKYVKDTVETFCMESPGFFSYLQKEKQPLSLCGDAVERLVQEAKDQGFPIQDFFIDIKYVALANPAVLANIGKENYKINCGGAKIQPVYMRDADVSVSNKIYRTLDQKELLQ